MACATLVAFLMTATTLFLVPYGNLASKTLLFDMARQKASIGIREKVFIDDFQGILLYAEKIPVHGDFLEGVLISDNRISREPSTIIARRAYLISNPDTMVITLRLEDGSTHTVDAGLNHYRKMDFRFYDVRLDLADRSPRIKRANKIQYGDERIRTRRTLRKHAVDEGACASWRFELNKKLTIPFSCLVFALIGVPLGIRAHRSVRRAGSNRLSSRPRLLPASPQRRGAGRNGKTLPDHRDMDAQLDFSPSPEFSLSLCGARKIIMKIVDRYLIQEYLRNLLLITVSFLSLFLIIDFFEKIRMFLSNHATFQQMASYFLFRIPMIISQILPAAILLRPGDLRKSLPAQRNHGHEGQRHQPLPDFPPHPDHRRPDLPADFFPERMGHPPYQRKGRAHPSDRGAETTVPGQLQTGSDLVPGAEGYLQLPAVRRADERSRGSPSITSTVR